MAVGLVCGNLSLSLKNSPVSYGVLMTRSDFLPSVLSAGTKHSSDLEVILTHLEKEWDMLLRLFSPARSDVRFVCAFCLPCTVLGYIDIIALWCFTPGTFFCGCSRLFSWSKVAEWMCVGHLWGFVHGQGSRFIRGLATRVSLSLCATMLARNCWLNPATWWPALEFKKNKLFTPFFSPQFRDIQLVVSLVRSL